MRANSVVQFIYLYFRLNVPASNVLESIYVSEHHAARTKSRENKRKKKGTHFPASRASGSRGSHARRVSKRATSLDLTCGLRETRRRDSSRSFYRRLRDGGDATAPRSRARTRAGSLDAAAYLSLISKIAGARAISREAQHKRRPFLSPFIRSHEHERAGEPPQFDLPHRARVASRSRCVHPASFFSCENFLRARRVRMQRTCDVSERERENTVCEKRRGALFDRTRNRITYCHISTNRYDVYTRNVRAVSVSTTLLCRYFRDQIKIIVSCLSFSPFRPFKTF